MALTPSFRRRLVRRGKFYSISIPPQLAELLGDCRDVVVKVSIDGNGINIEPIEE